MKALIIAFSMYSNIPMPQFLWEEKDMKYVLCFFPWVGAVAGCCVYFWCMICEQMSIGSLCRACIAMAVPVAVTGGFHIDGFMDVMDAFHSYQPKERKQEILKDSHIGAFAVIMLGAYGLLYLAAFSEVQDKQLLRIVCAGFFWSRCLSGISALTFPPAKKEGSLYLFTGKAQKHKVLLILSIQGVLCMGYMLLQSVCAGIAVAAVSAAVLGYYKWRSKKEFGGITGDTAGWFVLICEAAIVMAMAVADVAVR